MATHHTIFNPVVQARDAATLHLAPVAEALNERAFSLFAIEGFGPEDLANFCLSLPAWPVSLVKLHETLSAFNRLFLRFQFKDGEPAHDFFGLGKGPFVFAVWTRVSKSL